MMKNKAAICLCMGLLLMAAGCQTLKTLIKTPTVTFDNVSLKEATLFQSTLEITYNISNPNPVGLKLNDVSYRLVIDGKTVAEGSQPQGVMLPGNGSEKTTLPFTVSYMESVESVVDLFKKDSLPYEVSGSFKIGVFTIPYSYKDTLALPKPPKVSVIGLHLASMSFTGARLELQLDIENLNSCSLDLQSMNYGIALGGFQLMQGQTEQINLSKNQKHRTINVPLELNFLSLGKSAMSMLSQGNLSYEVTGDMVFNIPKLGPKRFPFNKTGQVGLTR